VKYIVLTYVPEDAWGASEEQLREFPDEVYGPTNDLAEELIASREFVYAVGLADPTLTQTVEIRDGVPIVTDGPYAEAKEILAGFGIVDVASHDRAMEVAAMSAAVFGRVEMRPLGGAEDGDDEP
jgi:hypothetical protein